MNSVAVTGRTQVASSHHEPNLFINELVVSDGITLNPLFDLGLLCRKRLASPFRNAERFDNDVSTSDFGFWGLGQKPLRSHL